MIKQDFSTSNPKLHELYVSWAMQHLSVVNEFLDRMSSFSNLNADDLAIPVYNARREMIDNNTAYRDAAARLMAGHPVPDDYEIFGAEETTEEVVEND